MLKTDLSRVLCGKVQRGLEDEEQIARSESTHTRELFENKKIKFQLLPLWNLRL